MHQGDEELSSDDAAEEEAEAIRLQRSKAEMLADDDFDLGAAGPSMQELASGGKQKKGKKKEKKQNQKRNRRSSDVSTLHAVNERLSSMGGQIEAAMEVERVTKDPSKLSKQEKLQIVLSGTTAATVTAAPSMSMTLCAHPPHFPDSPELLGMLEEFRTVVKELRTRLRPVLERVKVESCSAYSWCCG